MSHDCSQYKGLKRKLCEGWKVNEDGTGFREMTPNEHERYLASFEGLPIPAKDKDAVRKQAKARTYPEGPGTELEKLFSSFKFSTCGECARLKFDMNKWGPDRCEENRDVIIRRLESNAKRRKVMKRIFSKTAAGMFVDQAIHNARLMQHGKSPAKGVIGSLASLVSTAFKKRAPADSARKLSWSYGVTTVPERIDSLLPRTLKSLAGAGFGKPRLFVDKCHDFTAYEKFGLECTFHSENLLAYGNWINALWELYAKNPHADRYAIFQDDFVTYRNLRKYLDACEWPGQGYLNLFTFPANQSLAIEGESGWFQSNQKGLGALAIVFNQEAARVLVTHPHMVVRVKNPSRGHKFIDGGVVDTCAKLGWKEYVHNPTLVQHTGMVSSIGRARHPLSPSFMGEEFDAMDLIGEEQG